jgi:hypothetical protein
MRNQLEELWAELRAIMVWDRYYCLQQTHDEIDGVAWAARRQRLAEIQQELEELRQALPASVPGLFICKVTSADEALESESTKSSLSHDHAMPEK